MKLPINFKKFIFTLFLSLFISATLTACSDDKPKAEHFSFDHTHDKNLTDPKKHSFEHKFAAQCIEREVKNSVNKATDRKRFTQPCMCIAKRIMKDLTAVESEKFLVEKKHTQSLKMSFDEAAYFCLQSKVQPKAPVLFGKKK